MATATNTRLGDAENNLVQLPNPMLCEQCQPWDSLMGLTESYDWNVDGRISSLDELLLHVQCLVCQAVGKVVESELKRHNESLSEPPPAEHARKVAVENHGLFFTDRVVQRTGVYSPRIDSSDSRVSKIRLVIDLRILLRDHDSPGDAAEIRTTPRFCLHYSNKNNKKAVSRLVGIEPWETPYFNIAVLRAWIRGCEAVHAECVHNDRRNFDMPTGFRLVDVASMKVVRQVKPVRFVALSYMWKWAPVASKEAHVLLMKENTNQLEGDDGLANVSIPNIVSDAIRLCRDLGERFLWVDQLCIVQNDDDGKQNQILAMDRIYRSATFTIIAALNDRDDTGLPGYSGRERTSSSRDPMGRCEFTEMGCGSIQPSAMEEVVEPSLWNQRGWTFQERVLSRRRLFVTDFQAVFECSRGVADEAFTHLWQPGRFNHLGFVKLKLHIQILLGPNKGSTGTSVTHNERLESHMIPGFTRACIPPLSLGCSRAGIDYHLRSPMELGQYFRWVENYTVRARNLTFGSDVLNAFAGVGHALSDAYKSPMIFGLPEKYLAQSLLWGCEGSPDRRIAMESIPTWSWASSLKSSNYFWINGFHDGSNEDLFNMVSLVCFHYQDPELSTLRKLAVEERFDYHQILIQDFEGFEQVPHLEGKYKPKRKRSTRSWRNCPQSPWDVLARQVLDPDAVTAAANHPGSLVLNTTVASLRLGKPRDTDQESSPKYPDIDILTRNGKPVGSLNSIDIEWTSSHQDSAEVFEFMVICGSLADYTSREMMYRYRWTTREFSDMWRLHVMLIERLPLEARVVRRVEVGTISLDNWKTCGPQWETVVLC